MDIQFTLHNHYIFARALKEGDFENLFEAASNPLIWEQHPNSNRYKLNIFRNYFDHALESKGAYLISDNRSGKVIGSSRFYDYNKVENSIMIGYTFFRKEFWGGKFNYSMKVLMLDHIFQYVDKVFFHVGAYNIRSQKAIEKLGAKKTKEIPVAYAGEELKLNFEYKIEKSEWETIRPRILEMIKA